MQHSEIFDIAIIGAGVASAAALIRLCKSKLKIAVISPTLSIDFKIGENLSPAANAELQELGIYEAFLKTNPLPAHSKFSTWGSGKLQEKYTWQKRDLGWYLDRIAFEDFLWQNAQNTNFTHFEDKVLKAKWERDVWQIQTNTGKSIATRKIIDASGRSAVIMRNQNQRTRYDKLVCCYALLEQYRDEVQPTIASMIESVENGWFYSAVLPNGKMLVSFFTDSDLLPKGINNSLSLWQDLISQSIYTKKRIESAEFNLNKAPKITDAATIITDNFAQKNLIAIGDASACFDPLSSHGMTTALWSGRRAAEAILALQAGNSTMLENYRTAYQAGIDQYLKDRLRVYGEEKRFSTSSFWKRRHTQLKA